MTAASPNALALEIALRQMRARPLLTVVAIGGVLLGVLTLVTATALMWGSKEQFEQVVLGVSPDVVIYDTLSVTPSTPFDGHVEGPYVVHAAHGSPNSREGRIEHPLEIERAIAAMPEVEAASLALTGSALLRYASTSKPIDLRGVVPDSEDRVTPLSPLVVSGEWRRLSSAAHGIALGQILARDLGVKVGDVVSASTAAGVTISFEVVAVLDSHIPAIDRTRGYTLLRDAQVLFDRPDVVGRIHVRLRDTQAAPLVAERFQRMFRYRAESWQEANANYISLLGVQRTVASVIFSGILFLGGFGILAVQIMLVLQKQRDIAILRAVGFRRDDVLRVFLFHGVIMATVGGVLGDILSKVAIVVLGSIKVKLEGTFRADSILVADDLRMYAGGLVFAAVMGMTASILPAWRASRVEPVDVLRGQIG